MIQQGQVFKLKTRGADGQPLWAYRYRLDGRGYRRGALAGPREALPCGRAWALQLGRVGEVLQCL